MNATLLGRARRLLLPLAGVAALILAVSPFVVANSPAASGSADAGPITAAPAGAPHSFADVIEEVRPAIVNTAIYSPNGGNVGIGFAIPSDQARAVVAQLKKSGSVSRAWLGVQVQNLDPRIAASLGLKDTRGALISEVQVGGPADAAGVHAGDVVVSFDGKPVASAKALTRIVGATPADQKVSVTVWRDGRKHELALRLGNAAEPDSPVAAARLHGRLREDRHGHGGGQHFLLADAA
jgi:S1-C subfamily serine protease